jgi:zinc/manganese transport system substrate-binding protein
MKRMIFAAAALALLASPAFAETPIKILAAQNFYAEVATAIGGDRVSVETVAMPAGADPHDFEPPPSVARSVSDAAVVVFNGADYDHWMENLLESTERPDRQVIEAAIRDRFAGASIAATEPVFGYMADALGLKSGNAEFEAAVMNETEPSAKDVAALQNDLREHKVKALIYNTQVTDAMTEQLLAVAKEADVPVVGVTETTPEGKTYPEWMLDELDALEKALAGQSS